MGGSSSPDSFSVGGEAGHITVEVVGYENPSAQGVPDANWLRARVQLKLGGCEMQAEAALTTHDLKRFLDELEAALSRLGGSASLATHEDSINLHIELTKTGRARVSGELRELRMAKVRLGFDFESDQSYLTRTLHRHCSVHG